MATETESTIEGLTADEVDILREALRIDGWVSIHNLALFDGTENFTQGHIDQFNRQVVEGKRCHVDGKHESEVVLVPAFGSQKICEDHA